MTAPPRWFTIAAIAAILFEAMGVATYALDVLRSPQQVAALPIRQQLIWAATPRWITGAYAVAVFAGLSGAVGLALRRTWSIPLLGLSLLAVIVQFGGLFFVPRLSALQRPVGLAQPLGIAVVCALIYWLAHRAHHRGWLK